MMPSTSGLTTRWSISPNLIQIRLSGASHSGLTIVRAAVTAASPSIHGWTAPPRHSEYTPTSVKNAVNIQPKERFEGTSFLVSGRVKVRSPLREGDRPHDVLRPERMGEFVDARAVSLERTVVLSDQERSFPQTASSPVRGGPTGRYGPALESPFAR